MKKIFLAGVIVLLAGSLFGRIFSGKFKSQATGSAELSWNANSEADLAGYKIYYGTEPRKGDCPQGSGYPQTVKLGKDSKYKLENLENGKTYYFSITSYNQAGKESCFSEEMKKTIEIGVIDRTRNFFENLSWK